ncbi:FAS1-like dehydratase domain-containing protein [Muricoccus radiodurans]|uniref:FAS1-like dehydratase domain-containing protein n=1 Tax=Muricoccus radiodurans TaxID=2231721 RepID=UPI003CECD511
MTAAYPEYIGRQEVRDDSADPRLATGMAATVGRSLDGDEWPPLWHWLLFQDWRMPEELGPDGHPRRGGFLPPVHDLPRRMWAGGRVTFQAPIRTGDALTRTSTILSVTEKAGGSGRLVFVTVQHAVVGPRGPVLEEEQDIVYRGTEGAAVRAAPAAPAWPDAAEASLVPDPVMLFRYSALTGNGHRIHYDHPYVTGEEGYPGLVVHGPLQATLLARHALDIAGAGERLARFAYRGRRPCFDGRRLALLGRRDGSALRLETRDEDGATCQEAEAGFV